MRHVVDSVVAQALACGFLLIAATHLHAQESAGPIIRSESRTVLIDAVAVDKKGKFATDLAQKDFKIWEDGKEQKLTGFSLESSGISPERPTRHYIAMFFDTSTAGQTGQMAVRQEALRFVDGFASPDRYMAVINYNFDGGIHIAQNFTTDRDLLKKALSAVQASSNSTPNSASSAPTARGGRGRGAAATADPTVDAFAYRNMLQSLRSVVASLANIRGRKALVFFSGGMSVGGDLTSDLTATVDACNRANVAIYTVGPGPAANRSAASDISAPGGGRAPRGVQMPALGMDTVDSQNIPGILSEGTGGIAFLTTNDLAASLGKVAQEQDQYYLLSYTPTVDSPEGSCHELKVKVDRGDLEVRARKSYCTSKPADLLSGKPAGTALEARAASAAPGNIAAGNISAKMQLPWFYTAPNVARVNVAMEIVPSAMKFQKEKGGKLHGEFDLAGVAYKADGTAAARVSDVVKFDFDTQQQADEFLHAPWHYENQFEVAPGQYNFRMAFTSGTSDAQGFGKVELPLTVNPWNGQSLAISGIALSHDAHPAADLAAGLDVSLLEGQRPLVANGAELIPTGASQFHAGEPAYFYFEAYEPLLATTKPDAPAPLIGIRIRVLDRATGQQKSDTGAKSAASYERAGNSTIPVISTLPIANLPAGAYKLEVSVMRETGDPVIRTADFDIN
jgi:VWFA-related protein